MDSLATLAGIVPQVVTGIVIVIGVVVLMRENAKLRSTVTTLRPPPPPDIDLGALKSTVESNRTRLDSLTKQLDHFTRQMDDLSRTLLRIDERQERHDKTLREILERLTGP